MKNRTPTSVDVAAVLTLGAFALLFLGLATSSEAMMRAGGAMTLVTFGFFMLSVLIPDRLADWPPPTGWPAPNPATRVG
jgi:hypothetical protein